MRLVILSLVLAMTELSTALDEIFSFSTNLYTLGSTVEFGFTPPSTSGSWQSLTIFQSSTASVEAPANGEFGGTDVHVKQIAPYCPSSQCISVGGPSTDGGPEPPSTQHYNSSFTAYFPLYTSGIFYYVGVQLLLGGQFANYYSNTFNFSAASTTSASTVVSSSSTNGGSANGPAPVMSSTASVLPSASSLTITSAQTALSSSTTSFVTGSVSSSASSTPTVETSSTPAPRTSSATATPVQLQVASSSGLSAGAKAGIGIGAAVVAILVVLGALLFCRRNRKRSRTTPAGSSYGHVLGAHDRELQAEKEMNVVSSAPAAYEPIDRHPGFENHSPVGQTQEEPRGWYENGEDAQEYHDEPQTPAYGGAAGVSHLREPGMSPEELARLDEEERRLDEAIAEAERR